MMLASMIAPHPVGSEAPSPPLGEELVAGAHPDYLFALVASPDLVGSAAVGPTIAVVGPQQPQPVAVVKSSQWSMGIRRATQHPLVRLVYGLSSAGAMGVSYSENKSIPWALLHGFIGPAYLAYVGWNRYTGKGSKSHDSAMYDDGPTEDELARAFHKGGVAAQQGTASSQNPYESGSLFHDEWRAGWQENAPRGSQDWWGGEARANVVANASLGTFEAQTQDLAHERAGELASDLPFSAFEGGLRDSFAYPPDAEVADIWSEDAPEDQGSGARW